MAKVKLKSRVKPKVTTKSKVKQEISKAELREMAKEMIMLDKKLKRINKKYGTRLDALKKTMIDFANATKKDDTDLMIATKKGSVEISGKGETRQIKSMKKVRKLLGKDTWNKLATISLSDLDKYTTVDQREDLIEKKTGNRRLTIKHL